MCWGLAIDTTTTVQPPLLHFFFFFFFCFFQSRPTYIPAQLSFEVMVTKDGRLFHIDFVRASCHTTAAQHA
jgi:hypothetical protein